MPLHSPPRADGRESMPSKRTRRLWHAPSTMQVYTVSKIRSPGIMATASRYCITSLQISAHTLCYLRALHGAVSVHSRIFNCRELMVLRARLQDGWGFWPVDHAAVQSRATTPFVPQIQWRCCALPTKNVRCAAASESIDQRSKNHSNALLHGRSQ